MSRLSSTYRESIEAKITTKTAQLEALNTMYDEAILTGKLEEFRFDSGEGSQRVMYRSLKELADVIEKIEAQLDLLYRKLNGGGVIRMNVRRKQPGYRFRP